MHTHAIILLSEILLAVLLILMFMRAFRTGQKQRLERAKHFLAGKTDQAVLLLSQEGLIEWVNEGFSRMSGLSRWEVVGKLLQAALMEPIPNPKGVQQIYTGLASRKTFVVELLCSHKDGHRYWLSLHFTPVKERGRRLLYVLIGSDVTARKQGEEESLRVSRRNESLLSMMGEGIFTLDGQGNITFINPAGGQLTGWEPAELIGQPLGTLVHQLKIKQISGEQGDLFLAASLQQGTVLVGDNDLFRRKDGTLFAVEYSSSAVRESSPMPGAIVLFRDVTERQRAEALRRWQEQQTSFQADIVLTMAGGEPLKVILQKCVQSVVKHLQGDFAGIWAANAQGDALELEAGAGTCTQIDGCQREIPIGSSEVGLIASESKPSRIDDLAENPNAGDPDWIEREQLTSFAGVPLIVDEQLVGVLAVYAKNRLPEHTLHALGQVAECIGRGMVQRSAVEKMTEQAALLDKSQDAIVVIDLNHRVTYWNKSAERLYGYTSREVMGKPIQSLIYRDESYFERASNEVLEKGEWKGECCQVNSGDGTVIVESQWTLIQNEASRPKSILMVNTDVTEKKQIEAQFLRTQRMESIGTLAGGIAHDLNNVLAPILMSAELLKQKVKDEQGRRLVAVLESSARRGADMVKQVLTFSRGLDGERVTLQIRHLVKEVAKIMGETFPKTIQTRTQVAQDLWPIMGDATQLHQVVVNLAVNARDAMPRGGVLTLSAENVELEQNPADPDILAGKYVLLKVTDTGTGIPPEIRDKIFEPFFTTKEMGKGTGLGLATALGIIKSHSGFLRVQTEVNKGTTFFIYLPAVQNPQDQSAEAEPSGLPNGHGELILAVDDEASVLSMTKETLENYGYRVVTANDGTEAIAAYSAHRNDIKGVLTDMLMPYMDGPATIRVLKKLDPNLRILAVSGLMDRERVKDATGLDDVPVLMKPYSADKLVHTVHSLLHETN